jgi:hypothetical protein
VLKQPLQQLPAAQALGDGVLCICPGMEIAQEAIPLPRNGDETLVAALRQEFADILRIRPLRQWRLATRLTG